MLAPTDRVRGLALLMDGTVSLPRSSPYLSRIAPRVEMNLAQGCEHWLYLEEREAGNEGIELPKSRGPEMAKDSSTSPVISTIQTLPLGW